MKHDEAEPYPPIRGIYREIVASRTVNERLTNFARRVAGRGNRGRQFCIDHLPRNTPFGVPTPAGEIWLDPSGGEAVSNMLFYGGFEGYEGPTTRLVIDAAREIRGFVDVGAHIGLFSLLLANLNPNARIDAYEPFDPVRARLRRNLLRNASLGTIRSELVQIHSLALSDGTGDAYLYYDPRIELPSSTGLDPEQVGDKSNLACAMVPTVTLDLHRRRLDLESSRVDLMKIDVEGAETAVLRGATHTISRWRPRIICEILPGSRTALEVNQWCEDNGYAARRLSRESPKDGEILQPSHTDRNWLLEPR